MTAVDARARLLPGLIVAVAALWVSLPLVSSDSAALPRAVAHALAPSAAPRPARMPVGLREAASAAVGAGQVRFHLRQGGDALVARGGGLASRFDGSGVHVTASGAGVTFALAGAPVVRPSGAANRATYRRGDVTEWYVNGPAGLEQGFTLARPHSLSLRLSGTLVPRQRGQVIEFTRGAHGPIVLRYSGLTAFDADGRMLPARLELAGRTLSLRVNDAGASYPITIDPLIQQGAKLTGGFFENGNGELGWSVALSADGNTALLGAPADNGNVGSAFVFTRDGASWNFQTTLVPGFQEETGSGQFGTSVALSADGTVAVVGAPFDGASAPVGAAWVFTRSGFSWSEAAVGKITPADEIGAGGFGSAVALSGDGSTALISAPSDNSQVGAVWVYKGPGWTNPTKIVAPDQCAFGMFGTAVALSNDGTTGIVGADQNNCSQNGFFGAAWVFSGQGLTQTSPKLTGDANSSNFGSSVAVSSTGTVAVVGDRSAGDGPGAVWAFTGSGTNWPQSGTLVPAPSDASGFSIEFGASVALSADGATALIGGPGDGGGAGAAWIYASSGASWVQQGAKLLPSDESGSGNFGHSVALSIDASTALIGGPFDGANGPVGAAWPFAAGPLVSNEAATTPVFDTSATLGATVDPNGKDTTVTVEFGTTTSYGQTVSVGTVTAAQGAQNVTAALVGLQPSTTYHFRFDAANADGTTRGSDETFTTGPQFSGTAGTPLTANLATGSSSICPASATVDWGDGTAADTVTPTCGPLIGDFHTWTVTDTHTYANPAAHYNITTTVIFVQGQQKVGAGAVITAPPTITGTASQNVSTTSADVSATINPNGAATTYVVKYGTSTSYDQQTAAVAVGSAFTSQSASQTLSGLAPNTTYHFQFVATNSAGTTSGPDTTFTTAPSASSAPSASAPTIVGQAAPVIGATTATVSASINPNGSAATVVVQYGTTAAYGQQTAAVAIGAGTTLQIVNQNLTGLTPSTVYHFRFVATNGAGTTNGPDATFTTAVPGGSSQQPPPGPVQGVSANVFPLVGTVLVNGQPLVVGQQIPLGSTIDARNGTVLIRIVINGVVQEMQFAGGVFQLLQLPNGTAQLVLTGGDFSICKATKPKKKSVRMTGSASRADNAKTVRMLWGNGKGSFQTKGRYAAATVRGTIYQVADRCDGTFTRVRQGTVSVLDLVRNKTITVTAPKSLLVKAKP